MEGAKVIARIGERLDGAYNAGIEGMTAQPRGSGGNPPPYYSRLRAKLEAAKGGVGGGGGGGGKLAVGGQVARLMREATDDPNLLMSYIGWMPFV